MSTQNFSSKIAQASELIKNADYVLVGAGAGLSAAGGLNYSDPLLFKKWFPKLAAAGVNTIWEALTRNWYMKDDNIKSFWAYWANHINKIHYETPTLTPYVQLYELLKKKKYYIISTNVDGQFEKAGFDQKDIFAPQGEYALFQCGVPCSDTVYPNKTYIDNMVLGMNHDTFEISEEDIPHCPNCGSYLVKNIRIDETFVEAPHVANVNNYLDFVDNSTDGKLVLLELGVGFNTPVIIRWPFEKITIQHPNATLIRMNIDHPEVPEELMDKNIMFNTDIAEVLNEIGMNLEIDIKKC